MKQITYYFMILALLSYARCFPVHNIDDIDQNQIKRARTTLFDYFNIPNSFLTRLLEPDNVPATGFDKTESVGSVYYGTGHRSLSMVTNQGAIAFLVESNIGVWACTISQAAADQIQPGINLVTSEYDNYWTNGCRHELLEQLKTWKAAIPASAGTPLFIIAAQIFDLRITTRDPSTYRPWKLVAVEKFQVDLKHLLQSTEGVRCDFDEVKLIGYPAVRRNINSRKGFAIAMAMDPCLDNMDVEIWATGTGASNVGKATTYSHFPEPELRLWDGFELPDQKSPWDYWAFRSGVAMSGQSLQNAAGPFN